MAANTVPGAVAGWEKAYQYSQNHMNGTVEWSELLQTSIHYAKDGFPVTPSQVYWTNLNLDDKDNEFRHLQRFTEFQKVFYKQMVFLIGPVTL